jgi:CubicO group peptidase (beta-lactamase class C family)
MRSVFILLVLSVTCTDVSAASPPPAQELAIRLSAVDAVIDEAIAQGKCPGAVLYVGVGDEAVYRKAYGRRALQPQPVAMTADTVFDLASLSKPVGCSTSIMILADRGKLAISDKVGKYLPAFANHGKEDITIEMLLLHRGGLIPDNPESDYAAGGAAGVAAIMKLTPQWPPGTHFAYSDVGFIVLGELVKAVDGRALDRFAREEVFEPLGMKETTYNPPAELRARAAPTEKRNGQWIIGEVHDPRAYAMGGVAGHAGLFSTADDLARWCRMILHHGTLDGRRILSETAVQQWTAAHYLPDGTAGRAYGFDVDTGYSQPLGERFEKGTTFGHTGFTGTSFWIDPGHRCFVILLTNSVHPKGKGNVLALRRRVSTVVAEGLGVGAATTKPAATP